MKVRLQFYRECLKLSFVLVVGPAFFSIKVILGLRKGVNGLGQWEHFLRWKFSPVILIERPGTSLRGYIL